jgi:hypothetical protein
MSAGNPFDFNDYEDDRPRRRDRDDDDRPRRRSSRDDDDDYDRTSRQRYNDQRDDFDDSPRRRRRGKSSAGDGLGIASMIVGIVAVISALFGLCCVIGSGAGIIIGIVAVILGYVGRSQGSRSGMGMSGIITGFAAIVISLIFVVLTFVGIAFMQMNPGNPGPGGGKQNFGNQKRF